MNADTPIPQLLLLAKIEWQKVHEAIHGPLDQQTVETVNELTEFLCAVVQAERWDDLPPAGTPLSSERLAESQEGLIHERR